MLVIQFLMFKEVFNQLSQENLIQINESKPVLDALEKAFFLLGNNRLKEGEDALEEAKTYLSSDFFNLLRTAMSKKKRELDLKRMKSLLLSKIKDSSDYDQSLKNIEIASRFLELVLKGLNDHVTEVKQLLKKEQQKGFLPTCEKLEDFELQSIALNQLLQDPFIQDLIHDDRIDLKRSELSALSKMDIKLLQLPLIKSLIQQKVLTLRELPLLVNRVANIDSDSLKTNAIHRLVLEGIKTIGKDNFDQIILAMIKNPTINVDSFARLLRACSQLFPNPLFEQLLSVIGQESWETIQATTQDMLLTVQRQKHPQRPLSQIRALSKPQFLHS